MGWFEHIKLEHETGHPEQRRDANREYILFFHEVARNLEISRNCIPTFRRLLSGRFPDPHLYILALHAGPMFYPLRSWLLPSGISFTLYQ